jgi:hypothetical protein
MKTTPRQALTNAVNKSIAAGSPVVTEIAPITFTVVAVSKNSNPFGLHSIILLAKDGTGWQLLKSSDLPKAGDDLAFGIENGKLVLPRFHSYECPTELPKLEAKQAAKLIKSFKHLTSLQSVK